MTVVYGTHSVSIAAYAIRAALAGATCGTFSRRIPIGMGPSSTESWINCNQRLGLFTEVSLGGYIIV